MLCSVKTCNVLNPWPDYADELSAGRLTNRNVGVRHTADFVDNDHGGTAQGCQSEQDPYRACFHGPWHSRCRMTLTWLRAYLQPIVDRIADWKFIDMAELLPEFWALLCGEEDSKKAASRRPKQVTDFLQCFALYCGVLGRRAIPELHDNHFAGKPGIRWTGLGSVRHGIPPECRGHREPQMVGD